jgi:hypothetical protein
MLKKKNLYNFQIIRKFLPKKLSPSSEKFRNIAIFGFKILGFSIVGVLQTVGAVFPLCGPALLTVFTDGKHIFQQVQ